MAGAKKKKPVAPTNVETPEEKKAPVVKGEVVFVNRDKVSRAAIIVDLVSGKRVPKDAGEEEQKEKFSAIFATEEVNPKGADALQFAYEKLGGLVRTPVEQKEADENAKEAQKKAKRRAIDSERDAK